MKISKEDPRLTSYAFDEIDSQEERAKIEQALKEQPELMALVEDIRKTGQQVAEALARESCPALGEPDMAALEQAARQRPVILRFLLSWPAATAAAAAIAFALLVVSNEDGAAYKTAPAAPEEPSAPAVGASRSGQETPEQAAARSRQKEQLAATHKPEAYKLHVSEPVSMQPAVDRFAACDVPVAMAEEMSLIDEGYCIVPPYPFPNPVQTDWNSERYDPIKESDFRSPLVAPLSTFSIDVDTASYANVRRFLKHGQMPPANAVRIEELINYFNYEDPAPARSPEQGGEPFAVQMAQSPAPWNSGHQLLRIALKGYEMPWEERPASNLVFLLDVSGSMHSPNKLPLVKDAMRTLIRRLDKRDRVAVVVYAGASGLILPSTTADNSETIGHVLDNLKARGSTNAGAGIQLAYATARKHFIKGGNNRVILCTDGDFNVGVSDRGELAAIAGKEAGTGISLTVLGFGMGNYNDNMLEELSNKGKGSYAYIDSEAEARKVFLRDLAANLFRIAKDVKIQVEFNPQEVEAYRLIGYENRRLKAEDFNNDRKKAGDIGPGHSIVALYEWIPQGTGTDLPAVDALCYQK
ncbi:MAG: YfbK domain-containing protein, partial [Coraliomargarita sp.]